MDTTTTQAARYFTNEPAALVATFEQRGPVGELLGLVVIDREGNRWEFDPDHERDAAIVAEARAEAMEASRVR